MHGRRCCVTSSWKARFPGSCQEGAPGEGASNSGCPCNHVEESDGARADPPVSLYRKWLNLANARTTAVILAPLVPLAPGGRPSIHTHGRVAYMPTRGCLTHICVRTGRVESNVNRSPLESSRACGGQEAEDCPKDVPARYGASKYLHSTTGSYHTQSSAHPAA